MSINPDPIPGYSPWPTARQNSPFLNVPGIQGLTEGVSQGQGIGFSPTAEFFSGGLTGTAPPSSVPPSGQSMWNTFQGSGGAPSSTAGDRFQQLINSLRGSQ